MPVAEEPVAVPAPAPESLPARLITVAAVGDMMIGTDFPENHLPDDDGIAFLADVAPWLWSADIAFGNLEGVLMEGGELAKKCRNPNACYLFRSPPRYAQLVPELPRLLHQALRQQAHPAEGPALVALLAEQRRTNRLLQGLLWAAVGFIAGLLATRWISA